jgi:hypothetical protein
MDPTPSLVEIFVLYGFGTIFILARVFCRTRLVGLAGYHPDDYLVWLVWLAYTLAVSMAAFFMLNADVGGKHTSLLTPEMREALPQSEYWKWELGSKIFMVGVSSYTITIWVLKFNMLFFYKRIVKGTWVERMINPGFALVGATAIAVILIFTCTCIPYRNLWQVYPDPGGHCVPENRVFFYSILVLNAITDLYILIIPAPVVLPIQTSLKRKVGLYLLFSLGVFVIVCAIVRVLLVFSLNQSTASAMWSVREDFVSIFVGQAPMLIPLFKPKFWKSSYGMKLDDSAKESGNSSGSHQLSSLGRRHKPKDPYSITAVEGTQIDRSESQEEIIGKENDGFNGSRSNQDGSADHSSNRNDPDRVVVTRSVQVTYGGATAEKNQRTLQPWSRPQDDR